MLYRAVAHLLWELPFALRLPPQGFLCWEPDEGLALFDPRPAVGTVEWKRRCAFLPANEVFSDLGPENSCFSTHDYLITSVLKSGREVKTAVLSGGPDGGFAEARPFTVANVFLCLRDREHYKGGDLLRRASAALNNLLDLYRFVTLDPHARAVRSDLDTYYSLVSVADVPAIFGDMVAKDLLLKIGELKFGSTIGVDRTHHIGANSYDDLLSGDVLPPESLNLLVALGAIRQELEVFHQLFFSAVRRLKRHESALAIVDAQSGFESLVSSILSEELTRQGRSAADIAQIFALGGSLHTLQPRLKELDRITAKAGGAQRFLGSQAETDWRQRLYRLRNEIVHQGRRDVSFDDAKAAISSGLQAAAAVQALLPAFQRKLSWSGQAVQLAHVTDSAGRLARMFEI